MYTSKLKKVNGKLTQSDKDKILFDQFVKSLPEGTEIEMFVNIATSNGSLAQISKVHTCIRILAQEAGYTFEEMKLLVKQRSGLCVVFTEGDTTQEICKSFGECTKDELSMSIQACIEIGEIYNINLD
jgi:hypothetical protein